ncbi:MAG: type II toxin-antitoxin system VapC family toxin [Chloroflexi bacterium]|nr:MAG: type II toxin-antitoxin system VapC family toxin [Chloroflexota bacterium]
MQRYLLDTNHLSPIVTLDHPIRERIIHQVQSQDIFGVPVPALAEMLFGIETLPRRNQNLREWSRFSTIFTYYAIGRIDAEFAVDLRIQLQRRGRQLAIMDAMIAAIALRYGMTLLTTDGDFDPIPNLKRENWL